MTVPQETKNVRTENVAGVPALVDNYRVLTLFPSEVSENETPLAPRGGRTTGEHHVGWGPFEADDCAPRNKNVRTENGRSA